MCPSLSQGTRKALPRTGLLSLQQSGPDARSGLKEGRMARLGPGAARGTRLSLRL